MIGGREDLDRAETALCAIEQAELSWSMAHPEARLAVDEKGMYPRFAQVALRYARQRNVHERVLPGIEEGDGGTIAANDEQAIGIQHERIDVVVRNGVRRAIALVHLDIGPAETIEAIAGAEPHVATLILHHAVHLFM